VIQEQGFIRDKTKTIPEQIVIKISPISYDNGSSPLRVNGNFKKCSFLAGFSKFPELKVPFTQTICVNLTSFVFGVWSFEDQWSIRNKLSCNILIKLWEIFNLFNFIKFDLRYLISFAFFLIFSKQKIFQTIKIFQFHPNNYVKHGCVNCT